MLILYFLKDLFKSLVIQKIGHDLKIRMQTIATACVYFRRFYARRSFKDVDPFLLAPTCLTLASKVEESGLVPCNKLIITTTTACIFLSLSFAI